MKGMTTELKVGIFALVVLAIFSFMTFKVSDFEWTKKEGYTVYVDFNNIAGLDVKTKVKIAGVDAGVVDEIKLKDGRARVILRMYRDVKLYADASAAIKATGLLGDKFLSVNTGSTEPLLKDGDKITGVAEVVDIDDMARNLSTVSANINKLAISLNESFGTEEAKKSLRESIINLRAITENINASIINNDRRAGSVLTAINEMAGALRDIVHDNKDSVATTVANMRDFSKGLKSDGPELITNLNKATKELKSLLEDNKSSIKNTAGSIESITRKIDSGEGTIGKLVKDEKLYDSINKAVEGVNKTLSSIDRFRTYLTFQGDYLTKSKDGKGYFNITLQPGPEKYYILGVTGDPIGRVKTTETTTTVNGVSTNVKEDVVEKKIEFTAQIARRFRESAAFKDTVLRGGITENTFGVGLDQFFINDRLKVSLDAWDFGHDENASSSPHLRAGADLFIFKNLFISGGLDNILNKKWRGAYIGAGVKFEDEDIKYLMGTIPRIAGQ